MSKEVCQGDTKKVSYGEVQKHKHFYESEGEIQCE